MQPETGQPNRPKLYLTLMIIWGVIFTSIITLFLLSKFAAPESPQAPESGQSTLTIVLTVLGTLSVIASVLIRQRQVARAIERRQPEQVSGAYILAFALCEAAALFGMVIRFATNDSFYYLLFIIGGVGLLLNLPRQSDVADDRPGKHI